MYVNNFLLALKTCQLVNWIKKTLNSKYNVKNLAEIKIIIRWKVINNIKAKTLKIDQSAFIWNIIKEEGLSGYNATNIMKAGRFLDILEENDGEKIVLKIYHQLLSKLMYLSCSTRSDIIFVVDN